MPFFRYALVLPLFMLALVVQPVFADEPDRSNPQGAASAFLTAFKGKDLNAMAALVNESNREMFSELAAVGETHRGYREVFGGWRFEAATAWTGDLGEARYNKRGEAVVPFGRKGDEVMVVVLTEDGGIWALEDINSPSVDRFEELPTTP